MSDVKRYGSTGSLEVRLGGNYVLASDYDALAAELAAVRVDWFNESVRADAATARAEAAEQMRRDADDELGISRTVSEDRLKRVKAAEAKLAKIEAHARAHYWDDLTLRDLLGAGDDDKETP